jgi:hypothetical protein
MILLKTSLYDRDSKVANSGMEIFYFSCGNTTPSAKACSRVTEPLLGSNPHLFGIQEIPAVFDLLPRPGLWSDGGTKILSELHWITLTYIDVERKITASLDNYPRWSPFLT